MDQSLFFVYKTNVGEDVFIQDEYHELLSFAEIRLMHSCFCRLRKWNFSDLSAPFWRWYWNRNPGAWVSLGGRRYDLNPDRIFLIPPNTACATSVSNPVSQLYMHFVLGLDRATWPGAIFVHHLKPGERRLIDRLVTALLRRSDNRALEISFLSHALVNTALAAVPAAQWEGRLPEARIDQALRSIKASAPDPVTNERLAEEAGINVNAFTKLFLKATGQTPRQYLIQLRIEKACRLLEQNTMAIDQIAETSGFCDRYHFSRIFKKRVGVSPAAFRRRSRD